MDYIEIKVGEDLCRVQWGADEYNTHSLIYVKKQIEKALLGLGYNPKMIEIYLPNFEDTSNEGESDV